MRFPRSFQVSAALVSMLLASSAEAGCNCRSGSPSMVPVPMSAPPTSYAGPSYPGPSYGGPSYGGPAYGAPAYPAMQGRYAAPVGNGGGDGECGGRCNIGQYDPPPPPGTLGRTYDLCSRPLPEDEHPRNAGLEIRTGDVVRIDVEKMKGYLGEDGLWHFTTAKPWIPGRPAIVTVVLERSTGGVPVKDVRVVRLIPGRILSVEF